MKKMMAMLLALAMILSMAACGAKEEAAPAATEETPAATEAAPAATQEAAAAEEGVLKLQWFQQGGVDTLFESPWKDMQCLLPYMMFESLLNRNSDGSYIGSLASDWEVASDGLTYTFTIREGVKWHDGTEFTPEDVVFSVNAAAAAGSAFANGMAYVKGHADLVNGAAAEMTGVKIDGNKVIFEMESPYRSFLYGLCNLKILPKHLLGDVPVAELYTDEAFWSKPVGTGPYVLDKIAFPDYCTLTANSDYWGEQPGIKNVLFTSYYAGGNDAVVAALIAGDLDFAWKNALNDVEVANNIVAQNPDTVAKMSTSFYTRYFVYNLDQRADGNNKEDLLNKDVRKALSMLIDREALASFYNGQAVGLSTMVNPASDAYNDDIPLPKKDIETAKKMLEDAGFDFSQTIDMAYYYDDQTAADIMAMIKQDFAAAGVNLNPILLTGDLATLIYTDANYDLIYLAYSGEADPVNFHQYLTTNTPYNFMGKDDERGAIFDEPFAAYHSAVSDADAKAAGDKLQALDYEYCYGIPAYSLNTMMVYNAAKVYIPEALFEMDYETGRNWMFSEWKLVA